MRQRRPRQAEDEGFATPDYREVSHTAPPASSWWPRIFRWVSAFPVAQGRRERSQPHVQRECRAAFLLPIRRPAATMSAHLAAASTWLQCLVGDRHRTREGPRRGRHDNHGSASPEELSSCSISWLSDRPPKIALQALAQVSCRYHQLEPSFDSAHHMDDAQLEDWILEPPPPRDVQGRLQRRLTARLVRRAGASQRAVTEGTHVELKTALQVLAILIGMPDNASVERSRTRPDSRKSPKLWRGSVRRSWSTYSTGGPATERVGRPSGAPRPSFRSSNSPTPPAERLRHARGHRSPWTCSTRQAVSGRCFCPGLPPTATKTLIHAPCPTASSEHVGDSMVFRRETRTHQEFSVHACQAVHLHRESMLARRSPQR